MTTYKLLLEPKFSLKTKPREALVGWLSEHIQERRGGGWDVQVKGVRLRAGHDGSWRMGNFGVSVAAVSGLVMAIDWASAGQVKVQWWQSAIMMPMFIATAESMRGAGSAFSAARKKGAGPFEAFSVLCKRARVGLTSQTPNPIIMPMLTLGGVLMLATKLKNVVAVKAPGGKLDNWAQAAEQKIRVAGVAVLRPYEAVEHWKACSLVRACALESSESQGLSIYGEMASEFMAQRLGLSGVGAKPGRISEELLSDQSKEEQAFADKFEPYLQGREVDAKKIDVLMLRADVAGVAPWYRPGPGMPTLCEIGASLAHWSEASNQDVSSSLRERLNAWDARCEAQEIKTHVGAVRIAGHDRSGLSKKRL